MIRYPGIPSILDIVVRDSTQYFILIFFVQLLAQLFLFLAPVGDTCYVRGRLTELCSSWPIARMEFSSYRWRKFSCSSTPKRPLCELY